MNPLLQSLVKEVQRFIRHYEQNFADLVLADFDDTIWGSQRPIHTAYTWLQLYERKTV